MQIQRCQKAREEEENRAGFETRSWNVKKKREKKQKIVRIRKEEYESLQGFQVAVIY